MTLAAMTPETHDYTFAPLPPATAALGVPDPAGNRILLHHRYKPYEQS